MQGGGLIPGLGRPHILWGSEACAPWLLNPNIALEPLLHN